ncbi:MAG: DnaJ C-terminal domain-containing protein [Myxococcota bacterium]
MARDYYDILGIPRRAGERDIKAAYRRLARQYHPDVTGDDTRATERFKEITEAYEVLSDPQRRRSYDLFGHPRTAQGGHEFSEGLQELFELVTDVFRGRDTKGPVLGVDIEIEQEVSLEEAYRGTKRTVEADLMRPCGECNGRGVPPDSREIPCPDCGATGKVALRGPFPLKRTCPRCDGVGTPHPTKCRACRGAKVRTRRESLVVTIPAGVETGSRLRLRGRGAVGQDGPPGDLYVRLRVQQHPMWERKGDDLWTEVRVRISDALLGSQVEVPLPEGTLRITVPEGTQGGQVFRLPRRGFPSLAHQDHRGDAFVTVQIAVPTSLDADTRATLSDLAARVQGL